MKDIYTLLNDIDIDENEFEELEVNDIEKAKLKRTLKKSLKKKINYKKKAISVATVAIIVSTGVFGIAFPAYAKNVPIVGDIFRALDNGRTGLYDNYKENSSEINVTKESKGISVTINDAVFDGKTISLTYIVKSNRDLGENIFLGNDFKAKGYEDSGFQCSAHFEKIGDNTYLGQDNIVISSLVDNPSDFINLKIICREISLMDIDKKIKGNWSFDIALNSVKGITQFVDKSVEKEGIKATINEVVINPMSTFISYTQQVNDDIANNWDYAYLKLEVKDDLGNVYFSDSKGGSGTGMKYMKWSTIFEKPKEGATKLIITPIQRLEAYDEDNHEGIESNIDGTSKVVVPTKDSKRGEKEIILDDIIVELKK